jgi:uncharacterized SAM-binding protein YcdF (DUF218 family)
MILARLAIRIVFGLIAIVVLYFGITFAQVWWASRGNDTSPASAIIVMGAAQWNGVPSPVLKGRLDHAVDLYQRGVAPVIVVTGGKQSGDSVTQGLSGFSYLRDQGVPETAIKIEVDGTNSFEELSSSAAILRKAGIEGSVVIVSDSYHAFRVEEIAREVGLKPHVSPTDSSSSLRPMLRETVAVAIGRLIGFRRLASLR